MMRNLFLILTLVISFSSFARPASSACLHCAALEKIKNQFSEEAKKKKPDYNSLQLKASKLVVQWGEKTKLNAEQISIYVALARASVANDPGRSFLENTSRVLRTNEVEIQKAVSKLPPEEAKEILSSMQVTILSIDGSNGP